MPGNVSIRDLKLDTRLQFRARVEADVVDEYAQAMKDGASFPAIRVVRVDGDHLVVDGFHRVAAAKAAGVAELAAEVVDGTWRDAILAAAGANGDHGLRRTREDKRRAVAALLLDEDCAGMTSRELGTLAHVSHAHVNKVRRHYGVKRGEVLTEDRLEEVDGVIPPRWQPIYDLSSSWQHPYIDKMRLARSIKALRSEYNKANTGYNRSEVFAKAAVRRLQDLANADWPWPEDSSRKKRRERARVLDVDGDLAKALASSACPEVLKVWKAYAAVPRLAKVQIHELRELVKHVEGRDALFGPAMERLEADNAKHDAYRARFEPRDAIHAAAEDPVQQAELVRAADMETLCLVQPHRVHPDVQRVVQACVVEKAEREVCPNPTCSGWFDPKDSWARCTICRADPARWPETRQQVLSLAATLVEHHGAELVFDAGMTITAETLARSSTAA